MDFVKPAGPVQCPHCHAEMTFIGKASVERAPPSGGKAWTHRSLILSLSWDRKDSLFVASDLQAVHKLMGGRSSNASLADLYDSFLTHLRFEGSECVPLARATEDILNNIRERRYKLDSESIGVLWQLSMIYGVKNWLQYRYVDSAKKTTFFLPILPAISFKISSKEFVSDKLSGIDLSRLPIPNFWIRRLLRWSLSVRTWINKTSLHQSRTEIEKSITLLNEFISAEKIEYWIIDNSKHRWAEDNQWLDLGDDNASAHTDTFGRLTGPELCFIPWNRSPEQARGLLHVQADDQRFDSKGGFEADLDNVEDMLVYTRIRMEGDPGYDLKKEVTKWWGNDRKDEKIQSQMRSYGDLHEFYESEDKDKDLYEDGDDGVDGDEDHGVEEKSDEEDQERVDERVEEDHGCSFDDWYKPVSESQNDSGDDGVHEAADDGVNDDGDCRLDDWCEADTESQDDSDDDPVDEDGN
jgi:hypothetical protein